MNETHDQLGWANGHSTMSLNMALHYTDPQLERIFTVNGQPAAGARIRELLTAAKQRGYPFVPFCTKPNASGMCTCRKPTNS